MMNTAVLLAGGVGQRVGMDIPKQFLKVHEIPIMVYTLSVFQNHPDIDRICVVCVDGWKDEVESYKHRYGITKIHKIVPGGKTSMESIANGVHSVAEDASEDDIVIIHDSVRPLITEEIITDCIAKCKQYGNGCASIPLQETIVRTEDRICGNVNIDRSSIMRVQTPQAYKVLDLNNVYLEAEKQNITDSVYANTLVMELGGTIYFSEGSIFNIKITTREDLELFELMLNRYKINVCEK